MRRSGSAPCRLLAVVVGCVTAATSPRPGQAEFAPPSPAPVERLIKNVEAHLADHPDDAQGFYVLARLHTLVLALNRSTIRVYDPAKGLPAVDLPYEPIAQGQKPGGEPLALRQEQRLAHLRAALANYDMALERAPGTPLFLLGRAYAVECGVPVATELPPGAQRDGGTNPTREEIRAAWLEAAAAGYLAAFRKSIDADAKQKIVGPAGHRHVISHEAGNAYLRLVAEAGVPAAAADREAVEKGLAAVKAIPQGTVTPIIFPLDSPRLLRDLLSDRPVTFDLDGDLRAESWSWVRPDTGLLVWDPTGEGKIVSGRQLFGSVTWWMFWTDGYRALDALDDDRDGELRGAELAGLAVWRDATGNGVSEPGEVVSLATAGIVGLAVRATTTAAGCPANPRGVRFGDGRVLPSYDWIASPR